MRVKIERLDIHCTEHDIKDIIYFVDNIISCKKLNDGLWYFVIENGFKARHETIICNILEFYK